MSERIIGSYDDALYKSTYTLLHNSLSADLTSSIGVHDMGAGALLTRAKLSAIMRCVSRSVNGPTYITPGQLQLHKQYIMLSTINQSIY